MKKLIFTFILCLCFFSLFGVENQAYVNRTTAMRYLKLSQDYILKSQWDDVLSYSEIGLTYDSSLADLWYVKAMALSQKREKPFEIVENLEKALSLEWVMYNNNGAKLLLASYYCATLRYEEALALLEDRALKLNSEALKNKAKIFYLTNETEKARETINTAWQIFPTDSDFPIIFYTYENSDLVKKIHDPIDNENYIEKNSSTEMFYELNNQFLSMIFDYLTVKNHISPDLLLVSSSFADKDLQEKILKVYETQGITNYLYPIKAHEAKMISDKEAIDMFFNLSGLNVDYNSLEKLESQIQPEGLLYLHSYLKNFENTLLIDKNKDGFAEIKIEYKDGRPYYAEYEKNQDGMIVWESFFDYGVPKKVHLFEEKLVFNYAKYPFISVIEAEDMDYTLIPNSIQWLPFEVSSAPISKNDLDFYIITPQETSFDFSNILQNCSSVISFLSCKNQANEEKIRFLLSDGKIVSGNYYIENRLYASSVFEDGILSFRNIDKDLDGSFEVTEIYKVIEDLENSNSLTENYSKNELFGSFPYDVSMYLSSISVDLNNDGNSDYAENYFLDGYKSKKWDKVIELRDSKDNIVSITFKNPQNQRDIEVVFEDSKPIHFLYNNLVYPISYNEDNGVYWIGDVPDYVDSIDFDKIKQDLIDNNTSYSVEIYKIDDNNYFYTVKSFDFYFAQKM